MGNSHDGGHHHRSSQREEHNENSRYYAYFQRLSKGRELLSETDFKHVFNFGPTLASRLWAKYSPDKDSVSKEEYLRLMLDLENTRNKIEFYTCLMPPNGLTDAEFRELLGWFHYFIQTIELVQESITSAFYAYLGSDREERMTQSDICSWLNRNLPDIAEDLHRTVLQTLCQGTPVTVNTSIDLVEDMSTSVILNMSTLFLLTTALPPLYKKFRTTDSGQLVSYELEKLGHMEKLYDSRSHGFSSIKLQQKAFDYAGPLIILLKSKDQVFCIASDEGLKDDWTPFGGEHSRLIQLFPKFCKFVSGKSGTGAPQRSGPNSSTGIIYSNFTCKSGRRGILVGHQPIERPVLELDEGISTMRITGAEWKLDDMEVWAAGATHHSARLKDVKDWESKEVEKHKNRKIKVDWVNCPDRELLSMGGVAVRNADLAGGVDMVTTAQDDPDP